MNRKQINISERELSSGARLHVVDFGPAKIHTYVAPEKSFGDATHIIESENNLILVDSQYMVPYAKEFRQYADSLGKPIGAIIISHAHPDHYFGLSAAFSDIPSYALPEVIEQIRQGGPQMLAESKKNLGNLVPDHITIPANGLAEGENVLDGIKYRYTKYTDAEAETQLVIELPDLEAIILQDLISNGYHPWLGKTVPGWIKTLGDVKRKYHNYNYLFVGHGVPTLPGAYDQMINYLRTAENIINTSQGTGEENQENKENKEQIIDRLVRAYPNLKGRHIIPMYLEYMFPSQ